MKNEYKLPKDYEIREVETEEFDKLWEKPGKKFFNDSALFYNSKEVHSKKELVQYKKLRELFKSEKQIRINLCLYYKNIFVGWSWGFQETPTTFYMCNSAIFEEHRKKGLYTCLMKEMLIRAGSRGFAKIYSRHVITNNGILIAKLKQGFKITNFELSETFGTMIHLTYFPTKIKNDILDFRAGFKRPDKKMKKIFDL